MCQKNLISFSSLFIFVRIQYILCLKIGSTKNRSMSQLSILQTYFQFTKTCQLSVAADSTVRLLSSGDTFLFSPSSFLFGLKNQLKMLGVNINEIGRSSVGGFLIRLDASGAYISKFCSSSSRLRVDNKLWSVCQSHSTTTMTTTTTKTTTTTTTTGKRRDVVSELQV